MVATKAERSFLDYLIALPRLFGLNLRFLSPSLVSRRPSFVRTGLTETLYSEMFGEFALECFLGRR